MEILQVESTLVCTRRIEGLKQAKLLVLKNTKGKRVVAIDQVGANAGNFVFVVSGSAARHGADDYYILTDLTVAGIIDHWQA